MGEQLGTAPVRRRIRLRGIVQGVGFRPHVARLATELGVTGWCRNDERGVECEVQGPAGVVADFERRVVADAPPMAHVLDHRGEDLPPRGDDTAYVIVPSGHVEGPRTLLPTDTAVCDDCRRELTDPADRRFRHPFITCTNCGPRLSIIRDVPYDRPLTTLAGFPLCPVCAAEYSDPGDRRFHAQPIGCHDCGPTLWWVDPRAGDPLVVPVAPTERRSREDSDRVISLAHNALRDGAIVAVKGLGGWHLACDAASERAVATLRARKRRPDKPLALMATDLAAVAGLVHLDGAITRALTSPAHPIVLARRRTGVEGGPVVAEGVAPGLDELGVMLPYTPLHHLLLADGPGVLVLTSGNLSDEPLAYRDEDVLQRLGGIADAFLGHDRPVHVPVEDSVVLVEDESVVPVRRSRGYAPVPVLLEEPGPVVLAVGAEIKNTACLAREDLAFVSAHIGDMGSLESQQAFEDAVAQLLHVHRADPEVVAADLHPGYASTAWAERFAGAAGVPLVHVQHHHAHGASLLAEHGRTHERCLVIAFDGTGYGCDGGVWGGELLLLDGVGTAQRVGHVREFGLPGGELAVRRPVRVAAALLHELEVDDDPADLPGWLPGEAEVVAAQLAKGIGVARTSSVGRLVDGVSALLGVRAAVSYEAQAAIELEVLAAAAPETVPLPGGEGLDWGPAVRAIQRGVADGIPVGVLARGFHGWLANATTAYAVRLAAAHGTGLVGLTGGAFANRFLRRDIAAGLRAQGLEVLAHRRVPCNDGGLSLGQAVVARAVTRVAPGVAGRGLG